MFKKFIQRIIDAKNQQDAMNFVFYCTKYDANGDIKEYSIDMAFQHGKITWNEHQMLLALIQKMA